MKTEPKELDEIRRLSDDRARNVRAVPHVPKIGMFGPPKPPKIVEDWWRRWSENPNELVTFVLVVSAASAVVLFGANVVELVKKFGPQRSA